MTLPEIRKLLAFKSFVMPGDAAVILGVSRQRVADLIREGKLESFLFLGARRVVCASILRRIEARTRLPKNGSSHGCER